MSEFSYHKHVHVDARTESALVEGSEKDRLTLGDVFAILPRTLPFILEQKKHLLRLIAVFGSFTLFGTVIVLVSTDIFYNRILNGHALTMAQAWLLHLSPASYVHVHELSEDARKIVRDRFFVLFSCAGFAGVVTYFGALYYFTWIRQQINQSLRVTLMERVQNLSLRFHHHARAGDAIYRMYQDSAMVTLVIELTLDAVSDVVRYLIAIAVIFAFSPQLAGLVFVISCTVGLGCLLIATRLRTLFRVARETNSRLTSYIQASVAGLKVIKAFGIEDREFDHFKKSQEMALSGALFARNAWAMYGIGVFTVFAAGLLVGEAYVALLAHLGLKTFSTTTVFFTNVGFTLWNLGAYQAVKGRMGQTRVEPLAHKWGRLQELGVGLDRAFEILDIEPEVVDAPDAKPLAAPHFGVTFRQVDFSYDRVNPTLTRVDFATRPSTIVALVGPTGSGKSTMMSLLLRLFDPDAGEVLIGGKDIRTFTLESLRAHIGIALQENVLFHGTVSYNIAYAKPDASDDEIREAARLAAADDFIEALPLGYDTPLGERAARLSTGQRQRLSIARAIIKNPDILILDEPTAALDAQTEHRMMNNLHEWSAGKTIFIVTHRLSTIRGAHQILYIRDGQVIESGTHEALVGIEDGAYRRFVELERGIP